MATTITWLGHGSVQIETAGKRVLIDPFLTGQPTAPVKADDLDADFILVSHGHADHVGDTVAIAQRTGAQVISNFEISVYFERQGLKNVHAQHIGGSHEFAFGRVKLTIAHHGSALPDGSYGGNPCGFLLHLEEGKVYHAADTGLFYDMTLIGDEGIDLALLPLGDNFTMGPFDALRAVKLINPRRVVPIHYNTWELIAQDAEAWAEQVRNETQCEPVVLKPGESVSL
jgi:L-ascorbate metabolism protein UlaG (beta-lactamase superfamily)